jgi:arylsulfatase A-like enzyme
VTGSAGDWRTRLVWVGAMCCAVCVWGCRERKEGDSGGGASSAVDEGIRHLIVISLDTLRADYLPMYGHPYVQAPRIAKVASEGVVFDTHISCSPTTLASHVSLFTGCYPHRHGVARNGFVVPDENVMLAEVLQERGFRTAAFLGSYALASAFHFNQGFEVCDEDFDIERSPQAVVRSERRADRVTDAAIKWLTGNPAERLFLFVHYFDIHSPYDAPGPYGRMYFQPGWNFPDAELNLDRLRQRIAGGESADLPEVRAVEAMYGGEISFTDFHLGRLLDELQKRGILERSLLVITSDHGETFAEHRDLFNHGREVYETTVRTPLIVRFPKGRFGGKHVGQLVSNVDVMPTLLEWLGIPGPAGMEGSSYAGVLRGEEAKRSPVFCEATQPWGEAFESHPVWRNANKPRCVRTSGWKLIHRPLAARSQPAIPEWELYDLTADPREEKNLLEGDSDGVTNVVKGLKAALAAWEAQAKPLDSSLEMSDHSTKALKDLGYVR